MTQTSFPDTYLRLDASSYHKNSFFENELSMAESLGMTYHHISMAKGDKIPELSKAAHICLVSNTHTPVDKIPEDILTQTSLFLHPNSGYDNFNAQWVLKHKENFPILLGNHIRAQAVTQYILNELFSFYNQVPHHRDWDKTRKWDRTLLDTSHILIIGYGTIGQKLSASLSALSPHVTIYDPYQGHDGDLVKLSAKADIILFACSLNKESHHLFDEDIFSGLKENALLINPARGPILKEEAMIPWLKSHPHAFAICDVFEKEPFADQFHPITNIKTTSHVAGVSADLDDRIISFAHDMLVEYRDNPNFLAEYKSLILGERYIESLGDLL